jgi:hypothetical protein
MTIQNKAVQRYDEAALARLRTPADERGAVSGNRHAASVCACAQPATFAERRPSHARRR